MGMNISIAFIDRTFLLRAQLYLYKYTTCIIPSPFGKMTYINIRLAAYPRERLTEEEPAVCMTVRVISWVPCRLCYPSNISYGWAS